MAGISPTILSKQTHDEFFRLRFIEEGIEEYQIYLLIYDVEERIIVKWKK